ncbi:MAG: NAD(P)H-dependent oxidoreductase [Tannerella sp.]|jgi:NAD(P)H-dependent FMN reductase|nr:NAD(P)H-dependent oxidoreductase [Tannerella sp.]
MKKILAINGSASSRSANQKLIDNFIESTKDFFSVTVFDGLKTLPHFDPELSINNTPTVILDFRNSIQTADGIVICTPEYVFSIPRGLKNAIEWCISTTIFENKPTGLITASASGLKGHEELQLIMQTATAKFTSETTLLIQGIKGKINKEGQLTDAKTNGDWSKFISAFKNLMTANDDYQK